MDYGKWKYSFPDATPRAEVEDGVGGDIELQIIRIKSEVNEAHMAFIREPDFRAAEELMDVIHTAETALRLMDMPIQQLGQIKQAVITKNRERGYYL